MMDFQNPFTDTVPAGKPGFNSGRPDDSESNFANPFTDGIPAAPVAEEKPSAPSAFMQDVQAAGDWAKKAVLGEQTLAEHLPALKQQALDILHVTPLAEAGLNVASQLASLPIAGGAAALALAAGVPVDEAMADATKDFIYQPVTEGGKRQTNLVQEGMGAIGQGIKDVAFSLGQHVQKSVQAAGGETSTAETAGATAATVGETVGNLLPFERAFSVKGRYSKPEPLVSATNEGSLSPSGATEVPAPFTDGPAETAPATSTTPTEPPPAVIDEQSPRTAEVLERQQDNSPLTGELPKPSTPEDEVTAAIAEVSHETQKLMALETEDARADAIMVKPVEPAPAPEEVQIHEWEKAQDEQKGISDKVAENVEKYAAESPNEKIARADLPIVKKVGEGAKAATEALTTNARTLKDLPQEKPGTYVVGQPTQLHPGYWMDAAASFVEKIRRQFMPDAKVAIVGQLARSGDKPNPRAIGWSNRVGEGSYAVGPRHLLFFDEINQGPARARKLAESGVMSLGPTNWKYNPMAQVTAFYNLAHETGHVLLNYYIDKTIGKGRGDRLFTASQKGLIDEATIADLPEDFRPVVQEFNRLKKSAMDGTMTLNDWMNDWAGIWRNAEKGFIQRQLKNLNLDVDPAAPGSAKVFMQALKKYHGKDYEFSLPEYIAEQATRYAHKMNLDKGTHLGTKRFFGGVLKLLRDYFTFLKKEDILAPSTSFVNWLDSMSKFHKDADSPVGKKLVKDAQGEKAKRTRKKAQTALAEAGAPAELTQPEPAPEPPAPKKPQTVAEAVDEAKERFIPKEGLTDSEHAVNLRRQVLNLSSEMNFAGMGQKAAPNPKDPLIKEMLDLIKDGQHEEVARRLADIYGKTIEYDDLLEAKADFEPNTIFIDQRSGERVQATGQTVAGEDGLWVQATTPDGVNWWYLRHNLWKEAEGVEPGQTVDVKNTLDVLRKAPALKKPTVTKQEMEAVLKNPQFKAQDKAILRMAMRKAPAEKGKYSVERLKDMVGKLLIPFSTANVGKFKDFGVARAVMGLMNWTDAQAGHIRGLNPEDYIVAHPFVEVEPLAVVRENYDSAGRTVSTALYAKRFSPKVDTRDTVQLPNDRIYEANRNHGMGDSLGWVRAYYRRVKLHEDGPMVNTAMIMEIQSDVMQKLRGAKELPKGLKPIIDKIVELGTPKTPEEIRAWGEEYMKIPFDEKTAVINEAIKVAADLPGAERRRIYEEMLSRLPVNDLTVIPDEGANPYTLKLEGLLHPLKNEDNRITLKADTGTYPEYHDERMLNYSQQAWTRISTALEFLTDRPDFTPEDAMAELYKGISSNPRITLLDRAIVDMKAEMPDLQGVLLGPKSWLAAVEGFNPERMLDSAPAAVLNNWEKFRKDALKRYPGSKEIGEGWIYIDVSEPSHEVFYDEDVSLPEVRVADAVRNWGEDHNAQLRGINRLKLGYLQLQQLAHLYPDVKELNFASAANSKYNRVKGLLHAPAEAVAEKWMKSLGKEMQAKVGQALQREYEEGKHWTTMEQVIGDDGVPKWNHSINETVAAELKKHGIDGNLPAGKVAMEVYLGVKNALAHQMDYLERVLVKIAERARQDPMEMRRLMQEYRQMPFFPQTRFGQYIVEVVKGKDVVLRQAFEGRADWEEAKVKIAKGLKPGEKMVDRIVDEKRGHLQAIPQEFLAQMSNALELAPEDIDQVAQMMESFRALKALRPYDRAQARIRGADPDALRRFVSYAWHNGNLVAKMEVNSHFRQAIRLLEKKEKLLSTYRHGDAPSEKMMQLRVGINKVKNAIETTRDYLMYPPNEAQALRGWMTLMYLGANVKAAIVNVTGYAMTIGDLMARKGFVNGALAGADGVYQLGKALTGKLDPEMQRVYDRAVKENVLDQSYAYHLANIANSGTLDRALGNTGLTKARLTKLFDTSMLLFRAVEQGTRRMTFLEEFKTLRKSGMGIDEAYAEAIRLTDLLQNNYSFGNRPVWMRGARAEGDSFTAKIAGGTIPTLTLFMSWLQHASFHAFGGYEIGMRRRALPGVIRKPGSYTAYLALLYLGMSGITGLPGAQDLMNLSEAAARKLFGRNLKADIRNLIKEMGGDPVFWMHGLTHNINLGFGTYDISSSVGMGRMAPGVETLTGDEPTWDKLIGSLPAGSLFNYIRDSVYGIAGGTKTPREVALKAPGAVGHIITAYDWWDHRGFYDTKGRKILDREPTVPDIMMRALGFQPSDLTLAKEKLWEKTDMQIYWQARRTGLTQAYAEAHFLKDREALKDAKEEIKHFNALAPAKEIRITDSDLRKSLRQREMNMARKSNTGVTAKRYAPVAKAIEESFNQP